MRRHRRITNPQGPMVGIAEFRESTKIKNRLRVRRKPPKIHTISPKHKLLMGYSPRIRRLIHGWAENGTIYVVKGRMKPFMLAHEKAHVVLGHTRAKWPKGDIPHFRMACKHEVEASLYALAEVKDPKYKRMELEPIIMLLPRAKEHYSKISAEQALKMINEELDKNVKYIPASWEGDIKIMNKNYRKYYEGGTGR